MTESDRCAVSQSAQSSNEPSVAYSTVSGTQSPAQAASVSSTPVLGIVPTSESVTPSPNVGSNDTSVTDLDATMQRILHLAEEADGQCRICWVNGQVGQAHFTYRCDSGICSGNDWKLFKAKTRLPHGVACFLCFAPYGPPFNHEVPPAGSKYKAELCDYPDVLKELTYVLYRKQAIRNAIFTRLGHTPPSTLVMYWRFLGKKRAGGLLGVYEVLDAYLDLKEAGVV